MVAIAAEAAVDRTLHALILSITIIGEVQQERHRKRRVTRIDLSDVTQAARLRLIQAVLTMMEASAT